MNQNSAPAAEKSWEDFRIGFSQPAKKQIGALCYRMAKGKVEILLVTTRRTRRWIIPKGWPMKGRSDAKAAQIEAFEEAGIIGKGSGKELGTFASLKRIDAQTLIPVEISVFPIMARAQKSNFPEKDQRAFKWLPLKKAAEKCEDPGLERFLRSEPVKRHFKKALKNT